MMFLESLEPRRLLSVVNVTAKRAAVYEAGGTAPRFFYIRRDTSDLAQPLSVFYTVGGRAKQGLDYQPIGDAVTIKPGSWLRRIEIAPIDDNVSESTEATTLTLNANAAYTVDPAHPAATIRIISNDEPVPAPTHITWTAKAPSPIIRAEALRAVVDDKIYVFGGFSGNDGPVKRSDVYDTTNNAWLQIADLPTRLTHAGVAVDGRDVYLVGGYTGIGATGYNQTFGVTQTWKYNLDTNQFTAFTPLPSARAGGGAVIINHVLHFFGGNNSSRQDVGEHWAIDLTNPNATWQSKASLPDARSHMGYLAFNGKIYTAGGQHGNDAGLTTVASVQSYDPASDQWTNLAPLPLAISHIASAMFALDGRLIVAGGESAHEQAVDGVTAYDPVANTWTTLSPLPAPRFSGVAGAIGGTIYFTTGSSETTTWKGVLSSE